MIWLTGRDRYTPGVDGYITWISDDKASWTMNAGAVAPDPVSGAGQRVISEEPLVSALDSFVLQPTLTWFLS